MYQEDILAIKSEKAKSDIMREIIRNAISVAILGVIGAVSLIRSMELYLVIIIFIVAAVELGLCFLFLSRLMAYNKTENILVSLGKDCFIMPDGKEILFGDIKTISAKGYVFGKRYLNNSINYGDIIIEAYNSPIYKLKFVDSVHSVRCEMEDIAFNQKLIGATAQKKDTSIPISNDHISISAESEGKPTIAENEELPIANEGAEKTNLTENKEENKTENH